MVTWGRVREAEGEEWDRSNHSISSWDTRSSMLAYATVIERKELYMMLWSIPLTRALKGYCT